MRFDVTHVTVYRYAEPVVLAPHILRLAPRPEHGPTTSHRLCVTPAPQTRASACDDQGNIVTRLTFNAPTDTLRVESRLVQTVAAPPPISSKLLPLPWPAASGDALHGGPIHASVRRYAETLAQAAGHQPLRFCDLLTRDLYERTDRRIRLDGHANTAEETLATRTGACRDLTVLFMACARAQGIPARFVSGYQAAAESVDGKRYLHGWPEVWLGDGAVGEWRGYDPTHGLAVGDEHLALAVAPGQTGTMPLEGSYYGTEPVPCQLSFEMRVDAHPVGVGVPFQARDVASSM